MTINLTDPDNHPANGPLTDERIERVIEALESSLQYRNGSSHDHFIADAVKGLRELREVRKAKGKPVAFIEVRMLEELSDGSRSCGRIWPYERDELSGESRIPLYLAPPAPAEPQPVPDSVISAAVNGIMATYADNAKDCRAMVRTHVEQACRAAIQESGHG